jgi:hypothetical protein
MNERATSIRLIEARRLKRYGSVRESGRLQGSPRDRNPRERIPVLRTTELSAPER